MDRKREIPPLFRCTTSAGRSGAHRRGPEHANGAAVLLHELRPLARLARDARAASSAARSAWRWFEFSNVTPCAAPRARSTSISFQAPGLYQSLGYRIGLELRGFAPGTSKFTMVREFDGLGKVPD